MRAAQSVILVCGLFGFAHAEAASLDRATLTERRISDLRELISLDPSGPERPEMVLALAAVYIQRAERQAEAAGLVQRKLLKGDAVALVAAASADIDTAKQVLMDYLESSRVGFDLPARLDAVTTLLQLDDQFETPPNTFTKHVQISLALVETPDLVSYPEKDRGGLGVACREARARGHRLLGEQILRKPTAELKVPIESYVDADGHCSPSKADTGDPRAHLCRAQALTHIASIQTSTPQSPSVDIPIEYRDRDENLVKAAEAYFVLLGAIEKRDLEPTNAAKFKDRLPIDRTKALLGLTQALAGSGRGETTERFLASHSSRFAHEIRVGAARQLIDLGHPKEAASALGGLGATASFRTRFEAGWLKMRSALDLAAATEREAKERTEKLRSASDEMLATWASESKASEPDREAIALMEPDARGLVIATRNPAGWRLMTPEDARLTAAGYLTVYPNDPLSQELMLEARIREEDGLTDLSCAQRVGRAATHRRTFGDPGASQSAAEIAGVQALNLLTHCASEAEDAEGRPLRLSVDQTIIQLTNQFQQRFPESPFRGLVFVWCGNALTATRQDAQALAAYDAALALPEGGAPFRNAALGKTRILLLSKRFADVVEFLGPLLPGAEPGRAVGTLRNLTVTPPRRRMAGMAGASDDDPCQEAADIARLGTALADSALVLAGEDPRALTGVAARFPRREEATLALQRAGRALRQQGKLRAAVDALGQAIASEVGRKYRWLALLEYQLSVDGLGRPEMGYRATAQALLAEQSAPTGTVSALVGGPSAAEGCPDVEDAGSAVQPPPEGSDVAKQRLIGEALLGFGLLDDAPSQNALLLRVEDPSGVTRTAIEMFSSRRYAALDDLLGRAGEAADPDQRRAREVLRRCRPKDTTIQEAVSRTSSSSDRWSQSALGLCGALRMEQEEAGLPTNARDPYQQAMDIRILLLRAAALVEEYQQRGLVDATVRTGAVALRLRRAYIDALVRVTGPKAAGAASAVVSERARLAQDHAFLAKLVPQCMLPAEAGPALTSALGWPVKNGVSGDSWPEGVGLAPSRPYP